MHKPQSINMEIEIGDLKCYKQIEIVDFSCTWFKEEIKNIFGIKSKFALKWRDEYKKECRLESDENLKDFIDSLQKYKGIVLILKFFNHKQIISIKEDKKWHSMEKSSCIYGNAYNRTSSLCNDASALEKKLDDGFYEINKKYLSIDESIKSVNPSENTEFSQLFILKRNIMLLNNCFECLKLKYKLEQELHTIKELKKEINQLKNQNEHGIISRLEYVPYVTEKNNKSLDLIPNWYGRKNPISNKKNYNQQLIVNRNGNQSPSSLRVSNNIRNEKGNTRIYDRSVIDDYRLSNADIQFDSFNTISKEEAYSRIINKKMNK